MNLVKCLHKQFLAGCLVFVSAPLYAQQQPAATPQPLNQAASSTPAQTRLITPERIVAQNLLKAGWLRQLHWSSDSTHFAYIQSSVPPPPSEHRTTQTRKTTEIWSVDPATGHRSLLVSNAQLGSALGTEKKRGPADKDEVAAPPQLIDYAWAPGNQALLLTTTVSLAWIDLVTGHPRTLVSGTEELSDARLSPDGRHVSFLRDHALWLASTSDNAPARRLSPAGSEDLREGEPDWSYRHELDLQTAYWWSPDSSRIAYLEFDDHATNKYILRSSEGRESAIPYPLPGTPLPVVRVFVQPIGGGPRKAIDIRGSSTGYLPRVDWMPDSQHVAIEHLSRGQKNLDLFIVNATTGQSRIAISEKDDYWLNLNEGPRFLADGHRFLWTSERSGYRHLYLYDIDGRQPAQLTHGKWEVTALDGVDDAAGAVYFTATEESPLTRNVYRVGLDGAGFSRITQEKGTHTPLFSPNAHLLVDTYSNQATPPVHILLRADGSQIAAIGENAKPESSADLPPVEFLTVKTHMGTELNALMIRPPDFDPARKYPAIVYIDGAPRRQVVRDAWGGDTFLWLRMMAQKGYVIFAQDSQGSGGRGHLFEEPLHLRLSSQEMADQRDGTRYLRSLPYVDPARVGIYGWGYGGYLVLHAMLDLPIPYKAGFAGAPITDWNLYNAVFAERYLDDPIRNQDGYLDSTPVENAKNLKGSLLIAQGMMDEEVHVENTEILLNEFLETGKYPSLMFMPDRGHSFDDPEAQLTLYRTTMEFFLKNL